MLDVLGLEKLECLFLAVSRGLRGITESSKTTQVMIKIHSNIY